MTVVLITGASGFFGKALISALSQGNRDDRFVCLSRDQTINHRDPRFTFIKADLLDSTFRQNLIEEIKPEVCVHLAWHVPPGVFWQSPENMRWREVSVSLFCEFCRAGGRVFIGAGTTAEYDWSAGFLDEATTPLAPHTLYGQCKKALHETIRE